MDRADWFRPKWRWLNASICLALAGAIAAFAVHAYLGADSIIFPIVLFVAIVPLVTILAFIPVLHWRERYKGNRINIWGMFLVFETSGFTKIFYWFVHVLPDWYQSGPYREIQ